MQSPRKDQVNRLISYIVNTIKMNELVVDLFHLEFCHDDDDERVTNTVVMNELCM